MFFLTRVNSTTCTFRVFFFPRLAELLVNLFFNLHKNKIFNTGLNLPFSLLIQDDHTS